MTLIMEAAPTDLTAKLTNNETNIQVDSQCQGVTLEFILGAFLQECKQFGFDWSLPTDQTTWRARLRDFSYLSLSNQPDCSAAGHHFVPALFSDHLDDPTGQKYQGNFKLAKAQLLVRLDDLKHIHRDTIVRAAPLDNSGQVRPEFAVNATAGELVLFKTRDLVYNYIGTPWNAGVCTDRKETYLDYAKRKGEMINGIQPADWFLSHSWGMTFCDTIHTLLPSGDDCFVAMISPPCWQCWPLVIIVIAVVPFVGWLVLPLLGHRHHVLSHLAKPRWWTPKAVTSLGRVTYWVDIFCKNQFIVNSDDTAEELAKCVRDCGQTALACAPWENPECLQRVWCQFEIHHTYLAKTKLKACYSEQEKMKMDQQLYSWKALMGYVMCRGRYGCVPASWLEEDGSHVLGRTLSELKVADAQATVKADRDLILSSIAEDFGGDGRTNSLESADNMEALSKCDENIRHSIIDSIEVALGGADKTSRGAGKRRPRQIPLRIRVAYYSLTFQLVVLLIALVSLKKVQPSIIIYMLGIVLFFACLTFMNMAAKSHQMLSLLEMAGMGGELRAKSFRKERVCYFSLSVLAMIMAISFVCLQSVVGLL